MRWAVLTALAVLAMGGLALAEDGSVFLSGATEIWRLGLTKYHVFLFTNEPGIVLLIGTNDVALYNLKEAGFLQSFSPPRGWEWFLGAAVNPDVTTIAAVVSDGSVILWNVRTAEEIVRWKIPSFCGLQPAFLPDGNLLLGGSYLCKQTMVLNPVSGEIVKIFPDAVAPIAISPSGQRLAAVMAYEENKVLLWNVAIGEIENILHFPAKISFMAFDPSESVLFLGARDGQIYVWDLAGSRLAEIYAQNSPIRSLVVSPEGHMLAASSYDDRIVFWNVTERKTVVQIDVREEFLKRGWLFDSTVFRTDTLCVDVVSWSPDGKMISFSCRTSASGKEAFILRVPVF